MKAGWYERNGPAAEVIVVGRMADPEPGPGEVRVRIHASGVNPSDVKRRAGWGGQVIEYPRVVPHSDGAGVIDAVGGGVDPARVGERVWTFNAQWKRAFGTAAERVALPAGQAVKLPEGADFAFGACFGIPALTAHRAVFADGPVAGKTVLVTGGAGAVGFYATQLARWGGARVIATVSGPAKAEAALRAGAEAAVDYRREDAAARLGELTGGAGVDRVVDVDFGENLPVTSEIVKKNGVIAAYASMRVPEPRLPYYALMRKNVTVRGVFVYEMPEDAFAAGAADIARWVGSGAALPGIAAAYPLEELAAAHRAVESGETVGNVVVEI